MATCRKVDIKNLIRILPIKDTFFMSRRIIVTGHVEVEASPEAVPTHEYHLMVGQQIKERNLSRIIKINWQ